MISLSNYEVVIIIDSKGSIKFCNDTIQPIFGYTPSEILGKSLTIIIPEKFREVHKTGLKKLNSQKQFHATNNPTLGLKKDGTEFKINISISTWQSKKNIHYVAIIQDISKLNKVKHEIKENEQKYRKMFENYQDIFYQTDFEGKILEVSPSVNKYSKYTPKELIGKNIDVIYYNPPDRKKLFKKNNRKWKNNGL